MSPLQDTGNSPLLGELLGSFAVGNVLALRPAEGLSLAGKSLCWAEVALDLELELSGDGKGVDVRPPAASDILLAAHNMELRIDLFDIL